jgi:hypothetical protein
MTTDAWLPPPPPPPLEQAPTGMNSASAPQTWPAPRPLVEHLPEAIAGRALLAAIAAGVLAQLLFVFQMLGLNFPIWIGVVLAAAWRYRPPSARLDRLDVWLPVGAIVFAAFVALREDGMLLMFDVIAACSLTLASVVAFGGHSLTRGSWERVVELAARAVAVFWAGAVYVMPGAKPALSAFRARRYGRWLPLLRGVLIAIPLLLIFTALFARADAVFAVQLGNLLRLDIDADALTMRTLLAVLAGWLFAGTVACSWLARHAPGPQTQPRATDRLGTIEALVVLLLLDAMFAAFALLQAAYLFGGLDTFAVSGMTFSDYARRGFFELIIAAFLAGVVIIVLDRLVAERPVAYRLAAAGLAALTGIVVLAAFVRLGLYQAAYGWTELRFYALAAIGWLALGVLFTLAAVATRRARWLPQFVVGAGFFVAVVCNVVGPQAFVTEQNVHRALDPSLVAPGGKSGLDVAYLYSLGADGVPTLAAARDRLPADVRSDVDQLLRESAAALERQSGLGWQSWNLARQRAADALGAAGY